MRRHILIRTPDDFSFRATIFSHGWCELPPFAIDGSRWRLETVISDASGVKHTPITMLEGRNGVIVEAGNSKVNEERIVAGVSHILRLDDDLSGFYQQLGTSPTLSWIAQKKMGRLLRSVTVWEDLVKTICTTNCSWALTKIMVRNLVEKLGAEAGKGRRAFPSPAAMASMDEQFYRDEIRSGYRGPYFIELAQKVAGGELDPEQWLNSELTTAELKKEMKKVKGVGDYAAENLLKLVGRYDGLALDSWLRSQFYKKHNDEKRCPDAKIERHYKRFGEWRGLAIWCDMTEKWIA